MGEEVCISLQMENKVDETQEDTTTGKKPWLERNGENHRSYFSWVETTL